ncbi:hypothetical protein [Chitinophaga japonensis]|uniref:Uncharacterized protein n=1 Tax=Chitinophaga japonensis TaxID=104662 RepID=A0A562TE24_CHIJA|nr:hypothetical protein [Chitinophaga japonensis]TWI91633.1 hypothetical protein LX66_1008 [Chitinophaga japonensis]
MYKKNTLAVCILLVFHVSCRPVASILGYVKKIRPETPETVTAYIKAQGGSYTTLFTVDNPVDYKFFLDTLLENHAATILVYNKDQVNILRDRSCPWSLLKQVDSLYTRHHNQLPPQVSPASDLKMLQTLLRPIDGDWPEDLSIGKYDYYVFYTWAKFYPKLSIRLMDQVNELKKKNGGHIFWGAVNMDFQESWGQ